MIGTKSMRSARRGAALIYATVLAVAVAGMCFALLFMNLATSKVRGKDRVDQRSFYAAEAGLSDAYMQITEGLLDLSAGETVFLGTADAPISLDRSSYWVEIEPVDSRSWRLFSTGTDGRSEQRLQLLLAEQPSGLFQFAAFGDEMVELDSNSMIDSYDSALGYYDDQVVGGNDFAKENGHVGSNGDIILHSNTEVHGDATPGPGHLVDDSAPGTYVSGSTDPADEEFELVEIVPPVIASSGTHTAGTSLVLGPGLVHYDSITMSGGTDLTIVGPATVVLGDLLVQSGANVIFETSGGQVDVYGTGDFVLKSNSEVVTPSASALDVTLLLSGDNMTKTPPDKVELSSNAHFVGAIYAPNSEVSLGSNFEIYGSVMCGHLDLSSNGEIHYDEALMYDGFGSTDDYAASFWGHAALN